MLIKLVEVEAEEFEYFFFISVIDEIENSRSILCFNSCIVIVAGTLIPAFTLSVLSSIINLIWVLSSTQIKYTGHWNFWDLRSEPQRKKDGAS